MSKKPRDRRPKNNPYVSNQQQPGNQPQMFQPYQDPEQMMPAPQVNPQPSGQQFVDPNRPPNVNNITNQFANMTPPSGALGIEGTRHSTMPSHKEAQAPDAFFSITLGQVPQSQPILSKCQIPLGAIIHPLAPGVEVPQVNMGQVGIIRCKFCRAYINPFVDFLEGGRRWRCCFCYAANDGLIFTSIYICFFS